MKDLYTIQEFSQMSGVEASTLRYWDDIGLFSPIKRNPENNYRYYSFTQVLGLNFISVLSDLDFPLKMIAELRQNRDPDTFLDLLDKKEKEMDMEMRRLRLRYSIIHAKRELITNGMRADEEQISIQSREETPIRLWPRNEYNDEYETFLDPLASFIPKALEQNINLNFPVGGRYDSLDHMIDGQDRPQNFFSLDPVGAQSIPAGNYLTGYQRGYYGEFGDLPKRMASFAEENAIVLSGNSFAIYLLEEASMVNPDEYLVQIIAPVAKSSGRKKR